MKKKKKKLIKEERFFCKKMRNILYTFLSYNNFSKLFIQTNIPLSSTWCNPKPGYILHHEDL